jgi:hypothetical protein
MSREPARRSLPGPSCTDRSGSNGHTSRRNTAPSIKLLLFNCYGI